MLDITPDIDSLTNFKRNTAEYLERMKKSGHPLVLTVNGKPEAVVQTAESYQKMLEMLDYIQAVKGIEAGLKAVKEGRTSPAREALTKIKGKYEISNWNRRYCKGIPKNKLPLFVEQASRLLPAPDRRDARPTGEQTLFIPGQARRPSYGEAMQT